MCDRAGGAQAGVGSCAAAVAAHTTTNASPIDAIRFTLASTTRLFPGRVAGEMSGVVPRRRMAPLVAFGDFRVTELAHVDAHHAVGVGGIVDVHELAPEQDFLG